MGRTLKQNSPCTLTTTRATVVRGNSVLCDRHWHSLVYRQAWVDTLLSPYTSGGHVASKELNIREAVFREDMGSDQTGRASTDDADCFV